jgi:hypothetical protein
VPTKHDIDMLTKRVAELSKVADKLAASMKEAQEKRKVQHAEAPSAKKTAPKTPARAHT